TDIFEWHFTIRGPEDTEFEGGLYHGRILLPNNYPFAPPNLMFLTPNGRFELNKKICLNITGFYPEYWQPAWGIRTVLVAVMGFLPTESKGAIGGLDTSVEARKALAIKSKAWRCSTCQLDNITIVPDVAPENVVKASLKEGEMPPDFSFGYEEDRKKEQQKKQQQQQSGESEEAKSQTSSESSGSQELPKNTQPSTTCHKTLRGRKAPL
ncbi:Ubiquitin-conjugating enzyme E2 J1, partial [Lunasporangiospora selenospora]